MGSSSSKKFLLLFVTFLNFFYILLAKHTPFSMSFPLISTQLSHNSSSKALFLSSLMANSHQNTNTKIMPRVVPSLNYKSTFKYSMALIITLPIGTPPQNQQMVLDTGSQLSWIQCHKKIPKIPPPTTSFDPSLSSSFSVLPCSHPLCKPRIPDFTLPTSCDQNRLCHYSYFYADGTLAEGNLVREKITFSRSKSTPPLILGCPSFSYRPQRIPPPVSGVMLEDPKEDITESDHEKALKQKLSQVGIDIGSCGPGQYNGLLCPMCKGGGSNEKSLSLFITPDGYAATWTCFRAKCGWRGGTRAFADVRTAFADMKRIGKVNKKYRQITEESLGLEPLCDVLLTYFSERMISRETLRRNAVMQQRHGDQVVIAFTYRRDGALVSCKYRNMTKKFWQEADTLKIFYGLDDIKGASDIIIVEGEMDKLAMEEAGFRNCVSVPDGAPPSISDKDLPPVEKDTKYQYLWNCKEYLEKASRIILATDGDPPGQALAEELARRLGRERCWRVTWPKKSTIDHFKDANEVLMCLGPGALREVIEGAELYPIQGLFNFNNYFTEIDAYYHQTIGYELGVPTGWRSLNHLYNVVPGELTIVTGVPNSGKSEWIDALLCNLNHSVGWKFALCSMENRVREHARKLLEKHIKKPFFDVRYGESVERMSAQEFEEGKQWLSDTFFLIRCENDCLPNIDWVLSLAKAAVLRHGVNGLVIDPYNELDHQRPSSQTETEYVSQMLTKIKRFAQHHSCHVWFVAHPRQLHHWVGGPPNLYDISGSAHFINKCDNGIVIHRNRDPSAGPVDQVQVCVRKVRNKVSGTIGDAFLSYDRVTGEFMDIDEHPRKG